MFCYLYSFVLTSGPNGEREDFSVAVSTPQLLNCSRHVDLWVSWDAMRIRMGRGMLPSYHVLLDHALTEPYIVRAISVASGWGHEANFIIDEDVGQSENNTSGRSVF